MKHILSYNHDDLDLVLDRKIGTSISVGDTLILLRENDVTEGDDPLLNPWIAEMKGAAVLNAPYLEELLNQDGRLEIKITDKRIDFDHIKYWFNFVDSEGDDPYLK